METSRDLINDEDFKIRHRSDETVFTRLRTLRSVIRAQDANWAIHAPHFALCAVTAIFCPDSSHSETTTPTRRCRRRSPWLYAMTLRRVGMRPATPTQLRDKAPFATSAYASALRLSGGISTRAALSGVDSIVPTRWVVALV